MHCPSPQASGDTDCSPSRRNIGGNDRVRSYLCASTDTNGTDDLGSSAYPGTWSDVRAEHLPIDQADGDERPQHYAGAHEGEPVDDHLAVGQVHARPHDRITADADLARRDGQTVEHLGEHRDPPPSQGHLGSVADLSEERVGDPRQPQRTPNRIPTGPELIPFPPKASCDTGIGDDSRPERRLFGEHLSSKRRSLGQTGVL